MKNIFTILTAVILTATVWAQAPEKMSYQAVIRNSSDQLVTNQNIGMQISILQGSVVGTVVYQETRTPTTNANGLLTIEFGGQTGFDTINWANCIYFIKTEIDPQGGTDYTITGTSQLLSVPYALHAKTAESITGAITETDPVYTAWNKSYNDLTNKPVMVDTVSAVLDTTTQFVRTEVDGDPTNELQAISRTGLTVTLTNGGTYQDSINSYTAGGGIEITGTIISKHKYQVGDFAQGGIIFWLDETGEHGLVCAKQNQSTGIRWYAGTFGVTRATGDGPFSGEANTSIIIASQVSIGDDGADYAAQRCNDLQITEGGKTYGDWYLPSKEELNLMYQNKTTIDATAIANGAVAFVAAYYCSSTEYNNNYSWLQLFANGNQGINFNKSFTFYVRAVRAF